jgi:hypothetical protein
VKKNYRFRIQPVLVGTVRHFQLRVGMVGDYDYECIPVHCSAFAQRLPLVAAHPALEDAHLELTRILTWLDQRHPVVD